MEYPDAVSCSDLTELDHSEPRQASEMKATDDTNAFREKLMITDDVAKTLSLAPDRFRDVQRVRRSPCIACRMVVFLG